MRILSRYDIHVRVQYICRRTAKLPIGTPSLTLTWFASRLPQPQSQRLDFGAKQMALQSCTDLVYLSHAEEGQGDFLRRM